MSRRHALAWLALATALLGLTIPAGIAIGAPPSSPTPIGNSKRIEAEDFGLAEGSWFDTTARNLGGAYRDTSVDIEANPSGYNVGWIEAGEWLEYPIKVQHPGDYSITLSLASAYAGARTLHVEVDGRNVSGPITFDTQAAGWHAFRDVSASLGNLPADGYQLRVVFDSKSMNLDSLTITLGSPAEPPPAEPPPAATYPGRPATGRVLWGAAYGGNSDVVPRYEEPTGKILPLRRTYFSWAQREGYLINIARDDIAHGRIPWVSIKTPGWEELASGRQDAALDSFLRLLDSLGGPVWLTVHHEPEGGGGTNAPDDPAGPAGHRAMNKRVRERMTAVGTRNIALSLILMEWTWDDRSGRNPDIWWEPGVYDILGTTTYSETEASLIDAEWFEVRRWASARGVDVAVSEWGMRGTDAAAGARVRELYDHSRASATDGRGARVVGLAAFDSPLNSPTGAWTLVGAQYTTFLDILREAS